MYISQKYLHLSESKMTSYSSTLLSGWCFNGCTLLVFLFGGAIRWWSDRAEAWRAELRGEDAVLWTKTWTFLGPVVDGCIASVVYLLVLHLVLQIFHVEHEDQMEGDQDKVG